MRSPKLHLALARIDRQVDDTNTLPEPFEVDESQLLMFAFRSSPEEIIFEGSDTEACRKQCLLDLNESGYLKEATRELMIFSRRSRQAIRRWLHGEVVPQRSDWLRWQYWLRAKGYFTHELDGMPNSFFQLRKHIMIGDISFRAAAQQLGFNQVSLWRLLNNEIKDQEFLVHAIGNVHNLVAAINHMMTEKDIVGVLEVKLNVDGEFTEINKLYRLGESFRVQPDAVERLIQRS